MLGVGGGVLGSLVCTAGVWTDGFPWFCPGALGIGICQASATYYRFAALEAMGAGRKGYASAYALAGEILAASLVPSLTLWSRNTLVQSFIDAYLPVAALAFADLPPVVLLRENQASRPIRLV